MIRGVQVVVVMFVGVDLCGGRVMVGGKGKGVGGYQRGVVRVYNSRK